MLAWFVVPRAFQEKLQRREACVMTIQLLVLWVVCFAWLSSSISIGFLGLVQMRNGFLELPLSGGGFRELENVQRP
jgi:hypothetical protein